MPYISTFDRNQMMFTCWDALVDPKSVAREIDAFIEELDLSQYGVKEVAKEGRPSYDPKGLYKLYIYGNVKKISSSRKLAESCRINLEVIWLLGGVEPDFRTISDYRKNNAESIKAIYSQYNKYMRKKRKTKLNNDPV